MHMNLLGFALLFAWNVLNYSPCVDANECAEEDAVSLLQVTMRTVTHKKAHNHRGRYFQPPDRVTRLYEFRDDGGNHSLFENYIQALTQPDERGHQCFGCIKPPPARVNRTYEFRDDCGNHSLNENYAEYSTTPLIEFSVPANDTYRGTNAWCELNQHKICADAIFNEDFLLNAKSWIETHQSTWDIEYCRLNGFLQPELKALQHDFDRTKAAADELCNTKYLKYGWNSTLTMDEHQRKTSPGFEAGVPSLFDAEFTAAWGCAMGSLGCDLAFCAYTYCEKNNGEIGLYGECEGWDPVDGMPVNPNL